MQHSSTVRKALCVLCFGFGLAAAFGLIAFCSQLRGVDAQIANYAHVDWVQTSNSSTRDNAFGAVISPDGTRMYSLMTHYFGNLSKSLFQDGAQFSTGDTMLLTVTCYNSSSGQTLWSVTSSGGVVYGRSSLALSADGTLLAIAGQFKGTVQFKSSFGSGLLSVPEITAERETMFVVMYDALYGQVSWVQQSPCLAHYADGCNVTKSGINSLAFSNSGNHLYIGGVFKGYIPTSDTSALNSTLQKQPLLAQLDVSSGQVLWVQSAGDSLYSFGSITAITVNSDDTLIYVAGQAKVFSASANFEFPGLKLHFSPQDYNLFLAQLSSSTGQYQWVIKTASTTTGYSYCTALVMYNGGIIATGIFRGFVELDQPNEASILSIPISLTSQSTQRNDMFMVNVLLEGQYNWLIYEPGVIPYAISIAPSTATFEIAGWFRTLPSSFQNTFVGTPNSDFNAFIAQYDADTTYLKDVIGFGGLNTRSRITGLASSQDSLFVSGVFESLQADAKVDFDFCLKSASVSSFAANNTDAFVVKLTRGMVPSLCSGHGFCSGYSRSCSCMPGWLTVSNDSPCNVTTCYGIRSDNSTVCSGHGQCLNQNFCVCSKDPINYNVWTGTKCETYVPSCFNVSKSDPAVCSASGTCVADDTCVCTAASERVGNNCQYSSCFGIYANESSVCSGNGKCIAKNVCVCSGNYYSANCSRYCTASMCGHGTCSFGDSDTLCTCAYGWTGPYCDQKINPSYCFGISAINASVCGGHGRCDSYDTCYCNAGYMGPQCTDIAPVEQVSVGWVRTVSSALRDSGRAVAVASDGTIYAVGYTNATDSGIGVFYQSSQLLVTAIDVDNNVLWTAKSQSSNPTPVDASAVAVSPDGSWVIVAAQFYGNITIYSDADPTHVVEVTSTGDTNQHLLLIKFNSDGTISWVQQSRCSSTICGASAFGVQIAQNGNIFVACSLAGSVRFGLTTLNSLKYSAGLLKYSPGGSLLMAKIIVTGSTVGVNIAGLALARDNFAVYVTGHVFLTSVETETIFVGQGYNAIPFTLHYNDVYIAAFDIYGSVIWARNSGSDITYAVATGIVAVPDGLLVSGAFAGRLTLGDFTLKTMTGNPSSDLFVAKLGFDGTVLWARHDGGWQQTSSTGIAATDDGSIVYVIGNSRLGPAPLYSIFNDRLSSPTKELNDDIIVAAYSSDTGSMLFASAAGGINADYAFGIAIQGDEIVVVGDFSSSIASFDYCQQVNATKGKWQSMFVAKYLRGSSASPHCGLGGSCTGKTQQCVCATGWTNSTSSKCSTTTCFGKAKTDSTVCSGKGQCVGYNTCQCYGTHWGPTCSSTMPKCYGTDANDASVCSGQGKCVDTNQCVCRSGFSGNKCQSCVAGRYGKNCQRTCTSSSCIHGSCNTASDTSGRICNCNSAWTGRNCSVPYFSCNGYSSLDPAVCSGNGACTGNNICTCNAGYTGSSCSDFKCFGYSYKDSRVCSGHGTCVAPNTCVCSDPLVTDATCSAVSCNGVLSTNPSVCSGRGSCVATNKCSCWATVSAGFWNPTTYCASCLTGYGNGHAGNCTQKVCNCNGHGTCEADSSCDCDSKWRGDAFCGSCTTNYYGPSCSVYCNPKNKCNGKGTCSADGSSCQCYDDDTKGHFAQSSNPSCTLCKNGWYGSSCLNFIGNNFTFDASGSSIVGIFTSSWSDSSSVSCGRILNAASLSAVGKGAICSWPDELNPASASMRSTLRIRFGGSATLAPGDTLHLVLSENEDQPDVKINVPVLAPVSTTGRAPVAAIRTTSIIDSCTDLVLDGTQSTSPDGRAIRYYWSVSGPNSAAISSSISAVSASSASQVRVPKALLQAGTYNITLIVQSFLGLNSDAVSSLVTRSSTPVPLAAITGPAVQFASRKQKTFQLKADAVVNAQCFFANKALTFSWQQVSGVASVLSASQLQQEGRVLNIPTTVLVPSDDPYVFSFTATAVADASSNSTAVVSVYVLSSALVAQIAGGSKRSVSSTQAIVLDASSSYDPDGLTTPVATFEWSCQDVTYGGDCVFVGGFSLPSASSSASILTIPAGALASGSYLFDVQYVKNTRTAHASVRINVSSNQKISVAIDGAPSILNPNQKLVLSGVVSAPASAKLSYDWSITSQSSNINDDQIGTDLSSRNLVIKRDTFTAGDTITFQLNVSSPTLGSGLATATVLVNTPPRPGTFVVSPMSGVALSTRFQLQMLNWMDDGGSSSLTYRYWFLNPSSGIEVPLRATPSQDNRLIISDGLPLGNAEQGYNLTLRARVFDAQGAASMVDTIVSVTPPTPASGATAVSSIIDLVKTVSLPTTSAAAAATDSEQVLQTVNVLASLLNTASQQRQGSEDQSTISNMQNLREQMMKSIYESQLANQNSLVPSSLESVKMLASAVSNGLSGQADEINNSTSTMALSVFQNILAHDSDKIDSDVAQILVEGLSNVITSTTDSQLSNVANMTRSIVQSLTKNLVPGEATVIISTDTMSIMGAKQYYDELLKQDFSGDRVSISLPSTGLNLTLGADDTVELHVTSISSNPYYYSPSSANITTDVTSINLVGASGELQVSGLAEPIVFTIPGSFNLSKLPAGVLQSRNFSSLQNAGYIPRCVWWNEHWQNWTSSGCVVTNLTSTSVECSCVHLTDFAAIFAYFTPKLNILTAEDIANVTKVNKDNMLVVILVSVLAGLYGFLMISQLALDILFVMLMSNRTVTTDRVYHSLLRLFMSGFVYFKQVDEKDEKHEEEKFNAKQPIRSMIKRFFKEHDWFAAFFLPESEKHFNRYQRLTVLYACLIGMSLGCALTFNTDDLVQNEAQFVISSIAAEMTNTPFIILFTILFVKCRPRVSSFAVSRVLKKKQNKQSTAGSFDALSSHDSMSVMSKNVSSESSQTSSGLVEVKTKRRHPVRILDCVEQLLVSAFGAIAHFFTTHVWAGVLFILASTMVYFGGATGIIVFFLPTQMQWMQTTHIVAFMFVATIFYVLFLEMIYLKLKSEKYRKGEIKNWKLPRAFVLLSMLCVALLFVAAVAVTIALFVAKGATVDSTIQVIVIDVSLLVLIVCVLVFMAFGLKKPKTNLEKQAAAAKPKSEKKRTKLKTLINIIAAGAQRVLDWFFGEYWFPWWLQFIPFALAFVYIGVGSFFIVVYGIKFDAEYKGNQFSKANALSAVEDVLVKTPLQFLVKAVVYTILVAILEQVFFPGRRRQQFHIDEKEAKAEIRNFVSCVIANVIDKNSQSHHHKWQHPRHRQEAARMAETPIEEQQTLSRPASALSYCEVMSSASLDRSAFDSQMSIGAPGLQQPPEQELLQFESLPRTPQRLPPIERQSKNEPVLNVTQIYRDMLGSWIADLNSMQSQFEPTPPSTPTNGDRTDVSNKPLTSSDVKFQTGASHRRLKRKESNQTSKASPASADESAFSNLF